MSYCKRRMSKFNGIDKNNFHFHLKECEYKFNNRKNNLLLELENIISNNSYLFSLLYNS